MRLAWLSDTHLNFVDEQTRDTFIERIKDHKPSAVAISGDIAESHDVRDHLQRFESILQLPVYFVLGSHDYYGSHISHVRSTLTQQSLESRYLDYLSASGVVPLTERTALIGHDSWPDGRCGDFQRSSVLVEDFFQIKDLIPAGTYIGRQPVLPKRIRLKAMQSLARQAVEHFSKLLPEAIKSFENIIVVTHVPPFREACWYNGKISNDDYLPHFSCQTVGDLLRTIMEARPDRKMTVLCGHTHSDGEAEILGNLTVLTAKATYGAPDIQRVIDLE